MRLTLENYLSLKCNSISGLARKLGVSRETVRRWRDDKSITHKIVELDSLGRRVIQIEVGKMKITKGKEKVDGVITDE